MYDFLINPIRRADRSTGPGGGNLFVKRYLQGPQAIWDAIQRRGFAVRDLWDVTRIEDEFLTYLKNIVGWTEEPTLKAITDRLTDAQLRKLISVSVALWKIRGTESSYEAFLSVVTDARMHVWNWFDLRWILDETALGEDHQGRDPWLISENGDKESDIRIVDDGEEDRTLLLAMLRLFKPGGEVLFVRWIDFLDKFLDDDDDTQWANVGSGTPVVVDRNYELNDDTVAQSVETNIANDDAWTDYVTYWRARFDQAGGGRAGVQFFRFDDDNRYVVWFDVAANTLVLDAIVAGTPTNLATYNFVDDGEFLVNNVYYGVRVQAQTVQDPGPPTAPETLIEVWVDGTKRIDVQTLLASRQTTGKIGVQHEANATIDLYEVEMYQLPLETDTIGLNE
jgi:hypothetical protein